MSNGEAGLAAFFAATAFLCLIAAGKAVMEVLVILVPLALGLGLVGLLGFLWSLKSGQYDDLEGAAWRAIADDEPAREKPAA
jgi:cbb3-type cytochrome oxidase maturation protein